MSHDTSFNGQILKVYSSYTNWTLLNRGQTLPWKSVLLSDTCFWFGSIFLSLTLWPLAIATSFQKLFWSPPYRTSPFFFNGISLSVFSWFSPKEGGESCSRRPWGERGLEMSEHNPQGWDAVHVALESRYSCLLTCEMEILKKGGFFRCFED